MDRLARRARMVRAVRQGAVREGAVREDDAIAEPVETLTIRDGHHSWLFESPEYRATVGGFLARALGGPFAPDDAAARAAAVPVARMPDVSPAGFSAMEGEPGGVRMLIRAIRDA
jgi:hypothetical protein